MVISFSTICEVLTASVKDILRLPTFRSRITSVSNGGELSPKKAAACKAFPSVIDRTSFPR